MQDKSFVLSIEFLTPSISIVKRNWSAKSKDYLTPFSQRLYGDGTNAPYYTLIMYLSCWRAFYMACILCKYFCDEAFYANIMYGI